MEQEPLFSHAEPVLPVQDVSETIRYWQDVLGFPQKWTWGDPPVIGAVSRQNAFVQFTLNPALALASKGNGIWFRVSHIHPLYRMHQENNAEIVAPLEQQSWGMVQYTVRDLNGYYLSFAAPGDERQKSEPTLPASVRITGRIPTVQEYGALSLALDSPYAKDTSMLAKRLAAVLFAAVAEDADTGEFIGCALLIGDHASYYYVKDVMVRPDWQGKRVGSAMMQELNRWLDEHGANDALVSLITGESLEPFYLQFGFTKAFSMIRHIHRSEDHR